MSLVVDSHHHFWDPQKGDYPWMSGPEMVSLRRSFWPGELRPLLELAGVDKTVIVQTWSSLDETRSFLDIAGGADFVAGVVGWVDLTDPNLETTLEALKAHKNGRYLVGVRHQVHDEPDAEWLLRDDVQRGLALIDEADLVYDLLTRPRELPAALRTVERFPNLRFVIDHISKPDIAHGEIDQWRALMEPFAEHAHVQCKLSGMVTEANWHAWTHDDLRPYIEAVIEIFGTRRLMFGSDWPVSLLAAPYHHVKEALEANIATLEPDEREAILGTNAIEHYRLVIED